MAFYNLRVRLRAPNLKIVSFGLDLETPVSLTSAELQAIADDANAAWYARDPLYAVDCTQLPCTIQGFERVQDSAGPPPVAHREPTTTLFVAAASENLGTAAGQSVPPQNALVVTLRTASPDRRALGRVYTFAPPESVVIGTGDVSDAADRGDMVTEIVTAAEAAIAPVDVDHIVFSTRYGDQNEVIAYEVNQTMDTQRRRATR